MNLRQRLKRANEPYRLIWELDPNTCSAKDIKTLLGIKKARLNDPLSYLGLEAKWWLQENVVILKKRFTHKP